MRFDDDGHRADYIRMAGDYADQCFTEQPETLIYSGGIAGQDADRGPDIKRGDLMFTMVYTDMSAVEKHSRDLAPGEHVTPTFHKMYRTTGHGFLVKAV